eukprot:9694639-Karenia_brevis.AAC.1
MFLASAFNQYVGQWAHEVQRGFIRGRCMLQNVIEIESAAVQQAWMDRHAAILFFDFAAAFPSIARAFIWIALEAI